MSANPHANGGELLRDLELPDFRDYAVEVPEPGTTLSEATRVLGGFLRDVITRQRADNFRIFGPDETASNRLGDVFEVTDRAWQAEIDADRRAPGAGGTRHGGALRAPLPGLARGLPADRPARPLQLLRGVHPHRRLDVQPAREVAQGDHDDIPWRRPIASLNYLLSSHVWRQDHNGFSHQDPGFIDHVVNKKAEVIRVYLPPDANTLLSVARPLPAQPQLRQRDRRRQAARAELPVHGGRDRALHPRASASGSGPRTTTTAAPGRRARLLRRHPDARDARRGRTAPRAPARAEGPGRQRRRPDAACSPTREHPHGLSDREFDALFTTDRPVVFAYHGYPWLIHRLTYRRANHGNLHVRGYKEEGTTTTPFDMVMLNDLDRFHLVMDVIDRVPGLAESCGRLRQEMERSPHPRARLHTRAWRGRPGDQRLGLALLTRGLDPRRQRRLGEPEALGRRSGRVSDEARLARSSA